MHPGGHAEPCARAASQRWCAACVARAAHSRTFSTPPSSGVYASMLSSRPRSGTVPAASTHSAAVATVVPTLSSDTSSSRSYACRMGHRWPSCTTTGAARSISSGPTSLSSRRGGRSSTSCTVMSPRLMPVGAAVAPAGSPASSAPSTGASLTSLGGNRVSVRPSDLTRPRKTLGCRYAGTQELVCSNVATAHVSRCHCVCAHSVATSASGTDGATTQPQRRAATRARMRSTWKASCSASSPPTSGTHAPERSASRDCAMRISSLPSGRSSASAHTTLGMSSDTLAAASSAACVVSATESSPSSGNLSAALSSLRSPLASLPYTYSGTRCRTSRPSCAALVAPSRAASLATSAASPRPSRTSAARSASSSDAATGSSGTWSRAGASASRTGARRTTHLPAAACSAATGRSRRDCGTGSPASTDAPRSSVTVTPSLATAATSTLAYEHCAPTATLAVRPSASVGRRDRWGATTSTSTVPSALPACPSEPQAAARAPASDGKARTMSTVGRPASALWAPGNSTRLRLRTSSGSLVSATIAAADPAGAHTPRRTRERPVACRSISTCSSSPLSAPIPAGFSHVTAAIWRTLRACRSFAPPTSGSRCSLDTRNAPACCTSGL
mmetsp:Transcript_9838/g.30962  ORF Transcript_9838/g.30962 Transcript_9838/m.30962 type:complete len:618 (-) Transcript_9838:3213-5066(-)